jgi:hypothetical protein
MKRVSAILFATIAVAFGIGGGSSGVQNGPQPAPPQAAPPQQPIQIFPQQLPPVPATAPAPGSTGQSQPAAPAGSSNFLGKDVPFFDPGSNVATWDGKNWNVSNNTLFQARFEKYLNAPEATKESYNEYQALLGEIVDMLAPGRVTPQSIDQAFQYLAKASQFQQDAHLCDSIASQVYSAWLSRKTEGKTLNNKPSS